MHRGVTAHADESRCAVHAAQKTSNKLTGANSDMDLKAPDGLTMPVPDEADGISAEIGGHPRLQV
jgi:hypothetical protein